jgi:hypothetical protein
MIASTKYEAVYKNQEDLLCLFSVLNLDNEQDVKLAYEIITHFQSYMKPLRKKELNLMYEPFKKDVEHYKIHEQRRYLISKGIFNITKSKNFDDIANYKILFIGEPTGEIKNIFNKGNLYINQYDGGCASDKLRYNEMRMKLMNVIHQSGNTNYELIKENICNCYQGIEPCEHIKNKKFDIIVLSHVSYYLNENLINYLKKISNNIICVQHLFHPECEKDAYFDENKEIFNWQRVDTNKERYIEFNMLDDKTYFHKETFNYLYFKNCEENKNIYIKKYEEFEMGMCKHSLIIIKGEGDIILNKKKEEIKELKKIQERNIIKVGNHMNTTIKDMGEEDISLIKIDEGKEEEKTMMVKNIKGKLQISIFKLKANNFMDIIAKQKIKIYDKNLFINNFVKEHKVKTLSIDLKTYNTLLSAGMRLTEYNEKTINAFLLRIFQSINSTITSMEDLFIIAYKIFEDVLWFKIYSKQLQYSTLMKNIKNVKIYDEFSLTEKIIYNLGWFKRINNFENDEIKEIKEIKPSYNEKLNEQKIIKFVKPKIVIKKKKKDVVINDLNDNNNNINILDAIE